MSPDYANRIEPPPTGALSRPKWLCSSLGQFVLFHDTGMLYAYLSSGQLAWRIKARIAIAGFAVTDDNLYVQDGDVLCQYDATALQNVAVKLPVNAISFRSAAPGGWSYQDGDGGAKFESWFAAPMPAPAPVYSAPVVLPGDNQIHVLRSDGTVFSALLNLNAAIGTIRIRATRFVPDETAIYQPPIAGGGRQLCWISGGKIASLATGELEPAPNGIEAWRWDCLKAIADQPWQPLNAPAPSGFIGSVTIGSDAAVAIVLRDLETSRWTFHLVDLPCRPVLSTNAAMIVEKSGKVVSHDNPGIPAGLVTSLPPAKARERSGIITVHGSGAADVACAPYLREEDGGIWFAYLIAADADGPCFCKFRVPGVTDDFFLAWWRALQQARGTLQPILAGEIMYSLVDEVQQAIDSKIISVAGLANASSPLWSASARGIIPWANFDDTSPKYVTMLSTAVFVTEIEVAYLFPPDIKKLIAGRNRDPQPVLPLFGPFWMFDGHSDVAVFCNKYGFHGLRSYGQRAFRVPALTFFNFWTLAKRSIWVSQGNRLAQYDVGTPPSPFGEDGVPDTYVDVPEGTLGRGSRASWIDYVMTNCSVEPEELQGLILYYDDSAHRMGALRIVHQGQQPEFVYSAALDDVGAVIPGPAPRNYVPQIDNVLGPLVAGPQGADWRPNTGPLPEDILDIDGNPPASVLQNVAALQLNTSDNLVVQISGTPSFRTEGPDWFLYVCLKKADRYFFAKFAIPH